MPSYDPKNVLRNLEDSTDRQIVQRIYIGGGGRGGKHLAGHAHLDVCSWVSDDRHSRVTGKLIFYIIVFIFFFSMSL